MNEKIIIGQPKNKFRVYIRQTKERDKMDTHSTSFMVYDFKGNMTIDKLKIALKSIIKNSKRKKEHQRRGE